MILKNLLIPAAILCAAMTSCGNQESLQEYVDTRIGTAPSVTKTAGAFGKGTEEYGQTLPAVMEPNGMNFWTAQTRESERKCLSPYYYNDERIQGFRASHWMVGSCTQDYGSMTLMPVAGRLKVGAVERSSLYSHEKEVATPSYYSVELQDYGISAEMTGRSRSAIFRLSYPEDEEAWLVVNPNSDEGQGYIEIDTLKKEIRGWNPVHRIYQGSGKSAGFSGHFVVRYRNDVDVCGVYEDGSLHPGKLSQDGGKDIGAFIRFKRKKGEEIVIKAASSFTGTEGALRNLESEIPHWNFERTRRELSGIWEKHLAKITVQTEVRNDKEQFYSALYRASALPRTFSDVDGSYPSFAAGETEAKMMTTSGTYYEDFSMWDTYRALHPLLTIISPYKSGEMMQSLVDKYEQGGWMPIFPCWNSYTAAMIGDHCISAICDAYLKGIRNFDIEKAYEGMRQNAFESPATHEEYNNGMGRRALESYLKYGYIPLEDEVKEAFHRREQVSRTLEYAYDDYALSRVAEALGHKEDAELLAERSLNYRNVIDPETGYAQGRYADGSFLKEDNAFNFAEFITEGAPCHYTWYVPHDVEGLMECMGGKEQFLAKLDSMFTFKRYWHGNEPCHQVAYMFAYGGEAWKTQREVRHIMETEYLNAPGGLSGNDDTGQMSAWYIFSAMGFYPVCPGSGEYVIGSPLFPCTEIHLENGKTFTVLAHNASHENIYIQSAKLNGKPYERYFITHEDIISGGTLEVVMGNTPKTGND